MQAVLFLRKDFKNLKQTSHFYYLEESSSLYFLR